MANTEQTDTTLDFQPFRTPLRKPVPGNTITGENSDLSLNFQPLNPDLLSSSDFTEKQEYEFPLIASIKSAADSRRQEVQDGWTDFIEGKQDLGATFNQTIGKGVVGTATDIVGLGFMEGVTSAYALLPETAREGIGEYAGQAWNWLQNSPEALAAYHFAEQGPAIYSEWKKNNPQDARTLESIVNIGSILLPRRPKAPLDEDNLPLFMTAQKIFEANVQANKKEHAVSLLTPNKITAKNVAKGNVEESFLGTRTTKLSPFENKIADEVANLDIKPSYSNLKNSKIIYEAVGKEAEKLSSFLKDITIDRDFLNSQLDKATLEAKSNLLITADKTLSNVVDRMKTRLDELILKSDGTASSLLQVRKDFDSWVKGQTGTGAFGEKVTAISTATRTLRSSLNDVIQDQANRQVPLDKLGYVEDSLSKQHLYYEALDRIAPKVASESSLAVGRLYQTIKQSTQITLPTGLLSAAFAGSTLAGWLSVSSVVPIGIGAVSLAAFAGVRGDKMQRLLANSLSLANKAIDQTKDPVLQNILKADRAVIVGLLQNTETVKEEASK